MSFFPNKNSNSKNSNSSNMNSSSQNPGGGLVPLGSQSSRQTSVLNGDPNMAVLDDMDRQLVAVEEGQFRAVQAEFAEKQITEKMANLLSTQALFNKLIQDKNVGKVDINGVKKSMAELQADIENQRRILINAVDTIQLKQAEEIEFEQKKGALDRLVIQSQNRIPVEDAAAYITYIFERMSKKRDFDPVVTKRICDEIVTKFEEEMEKQGQVGLLQQYRDWIKSYIDEALTKATLSYLRAKALVKPTGQAAAGLTMIGLAATNLFPQLEYVSSVSQSLGPALLDDSLLATMAINVGRTLSTATTNTLIAATNLVTSAIASHPVAATFGGLSLLISAYWQLSLDHRGQVSKLMNELLEKLQFIWNQATDPDQWIPAYHKVNSLMAEIKGFLEDRGILIVDEEYDSVLSVRSASSVSSSASSSSSSSSRVTPLRKPSNSTVSSLTGATILSRASSESDSVSRDLFKETGQQLTLQKLQNFQALINAESASSSSGSSINVPKEVDFTRARSDISSLTATPFGSQDLDSGSQSSTYSLGSYTKGTPDSPGGPYKPVSQNSRAVSPHSQDSLIPNSPGNTPPGSPQGNRLESILGKRQDSEDSDMYADIFSKKSKQGGRRKSRRHGSRSSTKKRQYRKYRNTRKRSRRHTKKRSRK